MIIRWTKLSDDRHRLEVERSDGTRESQDLVTREFLLHDFVHLAVEREAKIDDGVWGLLAQGTCFSALNDQENLFFTDGLRAAEALTGPMQAVFKGQFSAQLYVEQLSAQYPIVDEAFVSAALEQTRKLMGHYRGTPVRGIMEIEVPDKFTT